MHLIVNHPLASSCGTIWQALFLKNMKEWLTNPWGYWFQAARLISIEVHTYHIFISQLLLIKPASYLVMVIKFSRDSYLDRCTMHKVLYQSNSPWANYTCEWYFSISYLGLFEKFFRYQIIIPQVVMFNYIYSLTFLFFFMQVWRNMWLVNGCFVSSSQ